LLAARDGVLADSLRFSLELEGFTVRLCDEVTLISFLAAAAGPGCLLLDQDVFERMIETKTDTILTEAPVPVILLAGTASRRLRERIEGAPIAKTVEKPLLGRALVDAVREAIIDAECGLSGRARGNFPPAPPPT
jgi:FixJ family two-component response regulator